jgi:hypothetical protein
MNVEHRTSNVERRIQKIELLKDERRTVNEKMNIELLTLNVEFKRLNYSKDER